MISNHIFMYIIIFVEFILQYDLHLSKLHTCHASRVLLMKRSIVMNEMYIFVHEKVCLEETLLVNYIT